MNDTVKTYSVVGKEIGCQIDTNETLTSRELISRVSESQSVRERAEVQKWKPKTRLIYCSTGFSALKKAEAITKEDPPKKTLKGIEMFNSPMLGEIVYKHSRSKSKKKTTKVDNSSPSVARYTSTKTTDKTRLRDFFYHPSRISPQHKGNYIVVTIFGLLFKSLYGNHRRNLPNDIVNAVYLNFNNMGDFYRAICQGDRSLENIQQLIAIIRSKDYCNSEFLPSESRIKEIREEARTRAIIETANQSHDESIQAEPTNVRRNDENGHCPWFKFDPSHLSITIKCDNEVMYRTYCNTIMNGNDHQPWIKFDSLSLSIIIKCDNLAIYRTYRTMVVNMFGTCSDRLGPIDF